jgi:arylformamidase
MRLKNAIMIITFQQANKNYQADLSKPIDISIPLIFNTLSNPNAWFCPPPEADAQKIGDYIVAVENGSAVNSMGVRLFPHGNGTHTEGVGHLMKQGEWVTINQALTTFHSIARLVSIFPTRLENGDRVILKEQLDNIFDDNEPFESLIIRTLPNDDLKPKMQWSGTNPTYFVDESLNLVVQKGIKHLLIDVPSVDKEDDGGKVAAHRAFWQFFDENTVDEGNPDTFGKGVEERRDATITEMIYVPNNIKDGLYLLNLQIPSFELDAAPSKPVLYTIRQKNTD